MWSIKSERVNLVAPASPVHRAGYSTNWDRKGRPGSEIQMYYGCPWYIYFACLYVFLSFCVQKTSKRLNRSGPNFVLDLTWPQGRFMKDQNFKNLCFKVFYFCIKPSWYKIFQNKMSSSTLYRYSRGTPRLLTHRYRKLSVCVNKLRSVNQFRSCLKIK